MKKFLVIILLLFTVAVLFANETAVLNTHRKYQKSFMDMDVKALLTMLHKEYQEVSAEGSTADYQKAAKLVTVSSLVQKIADNKDVTLSELIETVTLLQNKEFTAEMRQQIKALENSDEGKQLAAQIKPALAQIAQKYKESKAELRKAFVTYELISCKVDGETAIIKYKMANNPSNKMAETTQTWVKNGGKWLLRKSIAKYID